MIDYLKIQFERGGAVNMNIKGFEGFGTTLKVHILKSLGFKRD